VAGPSGTAVVVVTLGSTNQLRLTAPLRSGNDIQLSFSAASGKTYQVEFTSNLPANPWSNLGNSLMGTVGTGGTITATDPGAALLPSGFYRVLQLP
jgi:hypothetical protein